MVLFAWSNIESSPFAIFLLVTIFISNCSDMSFNNLSDSIPPELGQLQNIVSL
jgi:hypothetical protein